MGSIANITFNKYPEQYINNIGKRVAVCYHYDTKHVHFGTLVRDDKEEPYQTIIALDNGRYVLSNECQYRFATDTETSENPSPKLPLMNKPEKADKSPRKRLYECMDNYKSEIFDNKKNEYAGFQLYQLAANHDNDTLLFRSMTMVSEIPESANINYDLVYSGDLSDIGMPNTKSIDDERSIYGVMNQIYRTFNTKLPENYQGRSASVSDIIIVFIDDNTANIYYIEPVGFEYIGSIDR